MTTGIDAQTATILHDGRYGRSQDKERRKISFLVPGIFAIMIGLGSSAAQSENIDPNDDGSQYAWGENIGWVNAEPLGDGGLGVHVEAGGLTGYMWGENVGWISMSCLNNLTCATVQYGVANDGSGNLSGYAWGENTGWVSFSCTNTSSCGTVDYRVVPEPGTIVSLLSGTALLSWLHRRRRNPM